jgi:glutathione S-transferase
MVKIAERRAALLGGAPVISTTSSWPRRSKRAGVMRAQPRRPAHSVTTEGTQYIAPEHFARTETLQWLFFEQYSHEPYVAVLKFWTYWGGLEKLRPEELKRLQTRGQQALDVMEVHLAARSFFVGERYGIADIGLFAYTQSADAIGLHTGPAVRAWMARVREQPGFVAIKHDPLGKAHAR